MKIFIISLAIVLLALTMLSFSADMNRYLLLQKKLKILSEECANAASLCINEEEYELGNIVFNNEMATKQIEYLLSQVSNGNVSYEIRTSGPSVYVKLTYECRDIFRLPFISVTGIQRESCYEWK